MTKHSRVILYSMLAAFLLGVATSSLATVGLSVPAGFIAAILIAVGANKVHLWSYDYWKGLLKK